MPDALFCSAIVFNTAANSLTKIPHGDNDGNFRRSRLYLTHLKLVFLYSVYPLKIAIFHK